MNYIEVLRDKNMEKFQIEKLWNISNSLERLIEDLVFSNERRIKDIRKVQAIQKELDQITEELTPRPNY